MLSNYEKTQAIIPLQLCQAVGLVVRGYKRMDGRSGGVMADTVLGPDGKTTRAWIAMGWTGDAPITVSWGPDWKTKVERKFSLKVMEDGTFEISEYQEPRSDEPPPSPSAL